MPMSLPEDLVEQARREREQQALSPITSSIDRMIREGMGGIESIAKGAAEQAAPVVKLLQGGELKLPTLDDLTPQWMRDQYEPKPVQQPMMQPQQQAPAAASGAPVAMPTASQDGQTAQRRVGTPNGGVEQWSDLVDEASRAYGVPQAIIKGIMDIESGGRADAVSAAGAMGLMQVMPFHYGEGEDGMDPRTSVLRGAKILADNYRRWGTWDQAAAAYFGAIDAQGNITGATDATGTDGTNYVRLFRDAANRYGGVPDAAPAMQRLSLNAAPAAAPGRTAPPAPAGVASTPAGAPPAPWETAGASDGGPMLLKENDETAPMGGGDAMLPGDGGFAPTPEYDPRAVDEGPRESRPAPILPTDPTVSDPAYTQSPTGMTYGPVEQGDVQGPAMPAPVQNQITRYVPTYEAQAAQVAPTMPTPAAGAVQAGIDAAVESYNDPFYQAGPQPPRWVKIVSDAMQAFGTESAKNVARSLGVTDEEWFSVFGFPISRVDVAGFAGGIAADPTNYVGLNMADPLVTVARGAVRDFAPEAVKNVGRAVGSTLREGAESLGRGLQGVGREVAGGLRDIAEEAAYQATFGPRSMARNIVPPGVAREIPGGVRVPTDAVLAAAVEQTPGLTMTPDGIAADVQRFQRPVDTGRAPSSGGVFYSPDNGRPTGYQFAEDPDYPPMYGGSERIAGSTLLQRPFVEYGQNTPDTLIRLAQESGRSPQEARQLVDEFLALWPERPGDDLVRQLARRREFSEETYNALARRWGIPEMLPGDGLPDIRIYEGLRAALARQAGYDSVVRVATPDGRPPTSVSPTLRVSEIHDLREATYPTPDGGFTLRPEFQPAQSALTPPSTGRPQQRTVEWLAEQIDYTKRVLDDLDPATEGELIGQVQDRLGRLQGEWVDAVNARRALEPRIRSEVGRRAEDMPVHERLAGNDYPMVGRERVSPEAGIPTTRDDTPRSPGLNSAPAYNGRGAGIGAQAAADVGANLQGGVVGAAAGYGMPADSEEERRQNALYGAGAGMVGMPIAGRVVGRGMRGGGRGTRLGIIPPHVADQMGDTFPVRIPEDPKAIRAIESIGGTIDPQRGVTINVTRAQGPQAAGMPATRGGVFYEAVPEGGRSNFVRGSDDPTGVGGSQVIPARPTTFRSPLIVSDAPGGTRGFDEAMEQMGGMADNTAARARHEAAIKAKQDADIEYRDAQRRHLAAGDNLARIERETGVPFPQDITETPANPPSERWANAWRQMQELDARYVAANEAWQAASREASQAERAMYDIGTPTQAVNRAIAVARQAGPEGSEARAQALKAVVAKYGGDPELIDPLLRVRGADASESEWAIRENILAAHARRNGYDGVVTVQAGAYVTGDELAAHPKVVAAQKVIDTQPWTPEAEKALADAKSEAWKELSDRAKITELVDVREGANPTPGAPNPKIVEAEQRLAEVEARYRAEEAKAKAEYAQGIKPSQETLMMRGDLVGEYSAAQNAVRDLRASEPHSVGDPGFSVRADIQRPPGAQWAGVPFDPTSAAMGGAAGAMSEGEDGEQGDPLRTVAGILLAGVGGGMSPGARRALQKAMDRAEALKAAGKADEAAQVVDAAIRRTVPGYDPRLSREPVLPGMEPPRRVPGDAGPGVGNDPNLPGNRLGNVPPSQLREPTFPGMEGPYTRPNIPDVPETPNRAPVLGDVPPSAIDQRALPGMDPVRDAQAPGPVGQSLALTPEQRTARANAALEQFPQARNWYERARMRNEAQMQRAGVEPQSPLRWLMDLVGTVSYSSMLGPGTMSVNLFTGALEPLWAMPKEVLRGAGRAVQQRNLSALREPLAMAGGAVHGMTRLGEALIDLAKSRGAYAPNPDFPMLSARTADPMARLLVQALEAPGKVWSALPDAIFGTISKHAGEAREAAQIATNKGLKGAEWKAEVTRLLEDARAVGRGELPTSTETQRVVDAGNAYAKRQSYRDELGTIGRKAEKVAKLGGLPVLGTWASPFFRTPWNAALAQAEKSPIGFAMNRQASRFDKHYDAILGTAAILGLAEYARQGAVTGSGPTDPKERELLQQKGWQPYSVLVGNTYVPTRMFAIFEGPLNAAGELHDAMAYRKQDADERANVTEAAQRIGKLIRQNPYALSGLVSLMELPSQGVAGFAAEQITRVTPLAASARTIGMAGDASERTTDRGKGVPLEDEIIQRWQLGVGARSGLPVAQDAFGQPKANERPGGWAAFPRMRNRQDSPEADIFLEAGVKIGDPKSEMSISRSSLIPSMPLKPSERRLWDQKRGDELLQAAREIAADPEWATAPKEIKQRVLRRVMDTAAKIADNEVKAVIGDDEINRRVDAEAAKKAS